MSKEGHTHPVTIIDRSTQWAEAGPMASTPADSCASALIGVLIALFGVLTAVSFDSGLQFSGAVWATLGSRMGVKHIMTRAFHPQSNGTVGCFHC